MADISDRLIMEGAKPHPPAEFQDLMDLLKEEALECNALVNKMMLYISSRNPVLDIVALVRTYDKFNETRIDFKSRVQNEIIKLKPAFGEKLRPLVSLLEEDYSSSQMYMDHIIQKSSLPADVLDIDLVLRQIENFQKHREEYRMKVYETMSEVVV